ncbi:ABC transporter permease [Planctomycetota bacterium]
MIVSTQLRTLVTKEVRRFLTVWGQTVTTPVLSSVLYLFIFGYSLGRQISMIEGFTYLEFIIPGLVIMGIINASYQNTAFSILISKFHGNIHDILVAPISYLETVVAFTTGALVRGMLVGSVTFLVSLFFAILPMSSPLLIVSVAVLTSVIFAQVGLLAAIFSDSFDRMSMITNYVLMPLTYLSGVFYSIHILPPVWETLSLANPLFYMVDAFRYGFMGISDVNPMLSLGITVVFALVLSTCTILVLRSGYKLRK